MVADGIIRPENFLDKTCFVLTGAGLDQKSHEFKMLLSREAKKAGKTGVTQRTIERWFKGSSVRNERSIFFFLQILNDLHDPEKRRDISEDRKKVLGMVRRYCELTLELDAQNNQEQEEFAAVQPKVEVKVARRLASSRIRLALAIQGAEELESAVQELLHASGKNCLLFARWS